MANEEHLTVLEQGVETWNQWRKDNPGVRLDLREADLRGANLHRVDLSETDLKGPNLSRASLVETNFENLDDLLDQLPERIISPAEDYVSSRQRLLSELFNRPDT